jgi:hypothetical protein
MVSAGGYAGSSAGSENYFGFKVTRNHPMRFEKANGHKRDIAVVFDNHGFFA